ncbi:MAG TPA: hypothetical protein VF518_01655 [Polyangia bacterium]
MIRSRCFDLCACLVLSLTAVACGSSTSTPSTTGTPTGTSTSTSSSTGASSWDQARLGNTTTAWWLNAQKGQFFLAVKLKGAPADDTTGRALNVKVAQLIAKKSGSSALALLPVASDLPGPSKWVTDPDISYTASGPAVADNLTDITVWIDGGADPFFTSAYKAQALAWANYVASDDTGYALDLRVWQMASAADAKKLYSDLLGNSLYNNVTWSTCGATDCP